jgi:hypothetical protein
MVLFKKLLLFVVVVCTLFLACLYNPGLVLFAPGFSLWEEIF